MSDDSSARNLVTLRRPELVPPPDAAADRRQSKRLFFYRGEFPEAAIEFGGREYQADVYDLSTSGVGILPRGEITGLDTMGQNVAIRLGQTPARRGTLQNIGHIKFSGALRLRLGFRMDAAPSNLAGSHRYDCTDSMPLAYCDDPVAFNRTFVFNVTYFSESGLGLKTRRDDGAIYPGLRLDLRLLMPARGEFRVIAEVVSTTNADNSTEIHCLLQNPSDAMRSSISEFLLMTVPGLTIRDLATKGFLAADLEKAFVFRCAQVPDQFANILKLRLKAAQKDGRWLGEIDHEKMRDPWDKHARQIYGEINSQVVASARIVFNNGLPERSEHVSYGIELPDWLWEAGFVECSRLCTDPEFRGADLFFNIIQHVSRIVTQSGYRYIVMNCVDTLVPVYEKTVGVFSLGQKFHTPFMQDRALNLLCVDMRAMQIGANFLPKTWVMNAPVGSYLMAMGSLKLRWWEKLLRFTFSGVHRAAIALSRRQRRNKAKQAQKPRNKA